MNEELLKKAEEAESVDALLSLAKENKIELSKEKAEKIFTRLHNDGELGEDELSSVSGGGCSKLSVPKYAIGHYVKINGSRYNDLLGLCDCKYNCWIVKGYNFDYIGRRQYELACANCGNQRYEYEDDIEYGDNRR